MRIIKKTQDELIIREVPFVIMGLFLLFIPAFFPSTYGLTGKWAWIAPILAIVTGATVIPFAISMIATTTAHFDRTQNKIDVTRRTAFGHSFDHCRFRDFAGATAEIDDSGDGKVERLIFAFRSGAEKKTVPFTQYFSGYSNADEIAAIIKSMGCRPLRGVRG